VSTVTVSVVQNVTLTTTVADAGQVGNAVAQTIAAWQGAAGIDWGTLAVSVTDDSVQ
jgi:hypothetical protein